MIFITVLSYIEAETPSSSLETQRINTFLCHAFMLMIY